MNEEEQYLFDLRGFVVVRNALTPAQINDLSQRLEAHYANNKAAILGSDRTVLGNHANDAWSAPSLLELGGSYLDLIDLPAIQPYLTKLLGDHYPSPNPSVSTSDYNSSTLASCTPSAAPRLRSM